MKKGVVGTGRRGRDVFLIVSIFSFVFLILFAGGVSAANIYVNQTGSGTGSGGDWNNPISWSSVNFVRGNTYYIADGSYSGKTFNTAESGTTYITIKKATISDHGTNIGWLTSYGDGQANFIELRMVTDYYIIDGQKRNESNWQDSASYGFAVSDGVPASNQVVGYTGSSDHITVKYVDIGGTGACSVSNCNVPTEGFYLVGPVPALTDWTISRVHIHNVLIPIQLIYVENIIIEYSWLGPSWSKEAIRGQYRTLNVTVRNNIMKDACQGNPVTGSSCTAEVAFFGNAGSSSGDNYDNAKIYGNLIWVSPDVTNDVGHSDACIMLGDTRDPLNPGTSRNSEIYSNTFVGIQYNTCGIRFPGINTGSIAKNNIWYGLGDGVDYSCGAETCSNNGLVTSASQFVNAAGGNFHLAQALAGATLNSPYNIDPDGNSRGSDGVWDRGVYEYVSGPITYYNLTIQKVGTGTGTIYINGNNCASSVCSALVASGSATIFAVANAGTNFISWSNTCGTSNPCMFTINANTTIRANFTLIPPSAPSITIQPQSQAAITGGTATFSVAASGNPIPNYQWKKNGVNVGTNSQSYTTGILTLADNNSIIYVNVSNSLGSIISNSVKLTVNNISSNGLVAYYKFDEGSGNSAIDSSGNGNTGTITGATWTTGKMNGALQFNGASNYVNVGTPVSLNLQGNMSMLAWVKFNDVIDGAYGSVIIGQCDSAATETLTLKIGRVDGKLTSVWDDANTADSTSTITTGKWYLVGFTRSGISNSWTSNIYVDGILDASAGIATNPSIQTSLAIGRCGASSGQYFNGTIDEVRIYNRSLGAAEVFEIYLAGSASQITQYHPADTEMNWTINANEFTAYNRNFKLQLPDSASAPSVDYYSRANYLFKMGERYHFDSANAACNVAVPAATCWLSG